MVATNWLTEEMGDIPVSMIDREDGLGEIPMVHLEDAKEAVFRARKSRADSAEHLDWDVQSALTRLLDVLCTRERITGRQSVLILREEGGFSCRAMSGKPLPDRNDAANVADSVLLASLP